MSAHRLQLRLYLLAVIAAGGALLAGVAISTPTPRWGDLGLVALLFGMAAVAQLRPVHITQKIKFTVEDTVTFAAAVILDPVFAMFVAGGSTLVALHMGGRWKWREHAFNASVTTIGTGIASLSFLALAGPYAPLAANPLALLLAAALKYVSETTLVVLAASLQMRRSPLASFVAFHQRALAHEAALYLLAVLAILIARSYPWALVLLGVPMALLLLQLRQTARLRERTRAAILGLADLIDLRDPYTHGHSQRVAALAERLASRMRLQRSQLDLIREAARLHDIGKIATDDHVLQKPGPLDDAERAEMRRHAEAGALLLRELPEFWEGAALVGAHHERYDGRGYPRGLGGAELPLEVSIIAVADAYDAMTSDRPYRGAMTWDEARAELLRGRGSQWDPRVVDTFLAMIGEERRLGTPVAAASAPATS